ncbi:hypothetical protein M3Y97_00426900 [Aphelenchoides bicaudatus]|nr:hypothetical protein M3Y97_00426900 [Aphelenchoides bicaudatus]
MIAQSPLLLHLTASFLISTLRMQIEPENYIDGVVQTPLILISPNRNISLGLHGNVVLADGLPLSGEQSSTSTNERGITIMARCEHGFAFRLNVGDLERTIGSPSFCANHGMNREFVLQVNSKLLSKNKVVANTSSSLQPVLVAKILIGPDDREAELFYGCIRNVTFGPNKILSSWCRLKSSTTAMAKELRSSATSAELLSSAPPDLQILYIGERLKCAENGSVKILWKNLYLFPEHRRYRIQYEDVQIQIVDGPLHGHILLNDSAVHRFTYDDVINQRISYVHDGTESFEDTFDFKVWIDGQESTFSLSSNNPRILTFPLQIDPVDDLPQLMLGPDGGILNVTPILLTDRHLKIWDVDSQSTEVWIDVRRQKGAHLCTADGTKLTHFTLSQFFNKKVYLRSEGSRGEVELIARSNPSSPVILRLISAPVRVQLQANTGLKIPHRSSRLITSSNLSFVSNFAELPILYFVVDSPEFGLVECLREIPTGGLEEFQLCSSFSEADLVKFKVRYRHTSSNRPPADSFSFNASFYKQFNNLCCKFKVKSGGQQSPIHHFNVDFIPISVRVFIERSLLLNNTEQALIGRRNLLSTAYPETIPTDQLVYHIVEPPKYGMLNRQVDGGRMRRIGLSSNFTQQHIDDGTLVYKLHYTHFSVLNDFFMFRVVTTAAVTELLRFDITFIPGGNAIQLVNHTLVVREGHSQQISNKTLWLSTSDDSNFIFIIIVQPFFGNLELLNDHGVSTQLNSGDSFTSFDILNKRLSYKHSGRESHVDRVYLQAESLHHAHTQIPFWLEIQVVPENDSPPHLKEPYRTDPHKLTIHVKSERIFYHSLLPWLDGDSQTTTSLDFFFPELFREFTICRRRSPELPVRNFTTADLHSRSLLIRHVSLKNDASQRYLVSDGGKHTVQAELRFHAEPNDFVRLMNSIGPITRLGSVTDGLIAVKSTSLWAETNVDMDPEEIRYSVLDDNKQTPFRLLNADGKLQSIKSFTQSSIGQNRIFMTPFVEPQAIRLRLSALHVNSSDASFNIEPSTEIEPLQFRFIESISMPHSSILRLDSTIWRLTGRNANQTRFYVDRQPEHGSIVLQVTTGKSSIPINGQVQMFTKQQLESGNLRYLHHGSKSNGLGDWFSINFTTSEYDTYGPFRFEINFIESTQPVLVVVQNISLPWSASATINRTHLRALLPASGSDESSNSLTYLITKKPEVGRLLVHGEEVHTANTAQFTHIQLQNGQVVYAAGTGETNTVLTGQQQPTETTIKLKACQQRICSAEATLLIRIEADNLQSPELLRNEPLFVTNDQKWAVITSRHLHTADPDTSPNELRYLVWQPANGHLATVDNQAEPLLSFTQQAVNARQIGFLITKEPTENQRIGFSFLVTDGLHQTNTEWFAIERDRNRQVELDSNIQLNAAPDVLTLIGPDFLRARVVDVPSYELIYQVTRLPTYGKLVHENGNRAVTNFTQADIDQKHISYSSNRIELGAWMIRDYFNFVVANAKSPPAVLGNVNTDNDFRFRILLSFAFIDSSRLDTVLTRSPMFVTRSGNVMVNATFLNLTRLADLCDDVLFVDVERPPKYGSLEFLGASEEDDDEAEETSVSESGRLARTSTQSPIKKRSISADKLHSGRHLLYRHFGGQNEMDEFVLGVYALRGERNKKPVKLKVPIQIYIQHELPEVNIEHFRSEINLISGGSTTLQALDFKMTDPNDKEADLAYSVLQKGSNGVRVTKNGTSTELNSFTQKQIDEGLIRLEHTPADEKFDVIVLLVGGHTRVLFIRLEPIALQLFNHTDISFVQGNTYIVLSRKHLGADSNSQRSKIIYTVTKQPQNGSLFWVAGEKEVQSFTQSNIDQGDVLYAQLNMNAFQDSFDFVVSNDEMELLEKSSRIVILPPFEPQPLLTEARTIAQIGNAHLNASIFDGKSARYLVIRPPKYGRFFLYPNSNETIVFFTQSQIVDGRVFYQSFEVFETVFDNITLELRAEDMQPSRFNWTVRVATLLDNSAPSINGIPGIPKKGSHAEIPQAPQPPELNYRFPVLILGFVVASVVVFLLCRKNKNDKKKQLAEDAIPNIGTRELPEIDEEIRAKRGNVLQPGPLRRGNDLLDTTVYATSSSAAAQSSVSFMQQPPLSSRIKATTFESAEPETRQRTLGPAYRSTALSAITAAAKAPMAPKPSTSSGLTSRLNDNQYWV